MRRRSQIVVAVGVLAALQLAAIWLYRRSQRHPGAPATSGGVTRIDLPAPRGPFLLERTPGAAAASALSTSDGRPRLVHFWATWCVPCKTELPALLRYGRRLQASTGVELLAISVDRSWPEIDAFFAGAIPPEVVRAQRPDLHRAFGVDGLPDSYLVSGDGRLRARIAGARDWRAPATQRALEAAVQELR